MQIFVLEEVQEQNGRREGSLLLLAAAFVFVNAVTLSLSRGETLWPHLWAPLLWAVFMGAAHLLLHRYKPHRDPYIFPLFAFLTGWGLILIDRLAVNFLGRQVVWLGLSTAVLLAITILPKSLRILRRYRYTWLLLGLLLLAATLIFGVNPSGYGAALWLPVPFFGHVYFQPSELLKLLLLIFLASYFEEREPLLKASARKGVRHSLPYLAPLLLMWGFCMILLVWQRDLGAATLFFVVFLALLYLATGDRRYVFIGAALMAVASLFAYFAFSDLVALRVDAWWNPWPDANDRAFQIVQSLYALAAGHLFGQGVGLGFPDYIPVVHSDFVFAAIAEEWGLIGSLAVVVCFLLLAYRGMRLAILAKRPFHRYLAAGITIMFSAQTLLIMGGVTKLLPLTGVTLPFVSYGGSSRVISSVMLGLLLFLSGTVDEVAGWQSGRVAR
jgi:peptidoglycan glycosyltransferase